MVHAPDLFGDDARIPRLRRQRHRGARGARAGPQAPGHVHRRHRRAGAAPPGRRGARQRHGRGGRRPRQPHRGRAARRLLADRPRQRPRHPGRPAPALPGQVGARGDPLHAARRRQVLRQGLPDLAAACTASASRWSTRSPTGWRSRSRATASSGAQEFSRGHPQGPLAGARAGAEPPRHHRHLPPRRRDLRRLGALQAGAAAPDGALQGLPLLRRRDPLALRPPPASPPGDDTPEAATFHFPGGLSDYLAERLDGAQCYADRAFAGKVDFAERFGAGTVGSVEWAINWTPQRDPFVSSYCNTIHTPEGGTHEAGFWAALLKGIRAYGELTSNRKAAQITREDVMAGGSAMISVFIREPEFVGQTKDRLATPGGGAAGRGRGARPLRQLAGGGHPHRRGDPRLSRAEGRGAAAAAGREGDQPQDRGEEAAAAGQARRLLGRDPRRARSCSWSRATAPAARPSRRATARPRRCCRSGARS